MNDSLESPHFLQMHSSETIFLSQSSENSHFAHPAGPPQTMHFSSFTSWLAHFSCLTPSPFAQRPISFISIFWLHTMHVPGNFIGILRQLNVSARSPFEVHQNILGLSPIPVFCFSYKTECMANNMLQWCFVIHEIFVQD